jgi:hypothetical protein
MGDLRVETYKFFNRVSGQPIESALALTFELRGSALVQDLDSDGKTQVRAFFEHHPEAKRSTDWAICWYVQGEGIFENVFPQPAENGPHFDGEYTTPTLGGRTISLSELPVEVLPRYVEFCKSLGFSPLPLQASLDLSLIWADWE